MESNSELTEKIPGLTMRIRDQHSELYKYLEEMQVTIPNEKHPEITASSLRAYYDSLQSLLYRYIR